MKDPAEGGGGRESPRSLFTSYPRERSRTNFATIRSTSSADIPEPNVSFPPLSGRSSFFQGGVFPAFNTILLSISFIHESPGTGPSGSGPAGWGGNVSSRDVREGAAGLIGFVSN